MTKKAAISYIRYKIGCSRKWALRALVVIYRQQTLDEQRGYCLHGHNGVGFTRMDAEFLTSLAQRHVSNRPLTDNQMVCLHKRIVKYAGQLYQFSDKEKLEDSFTAYRERHGLALAN